MEYSVAITTYNRTTLLYDSFIQVVNDPRVREIVIVDDYSDVMIYEEIKAVLEQFPKVKLHRNTRNLGMSLNKFKSVELSSSEWVILFDSDNELTPAYLDALEGCEFWDDVIYCPSFAAPTFDFRPFAGTTIDKDNAPELIKDPMLNCCMNTCNYVVNRAEYMNVYQINHDMKGTDTIWFNYLWLKSGRAFTIVEGMEYHHRVHAGSGFLEDATYNMAKAEEVRKKIMAL